MAFPVTFWSAAASGGGGGGGTGYVNSVQYISLTIAASATTATATVSAPTGTYFILWNGTYSDVLDNAGYTYASVELTNSTTITATRYASDSTTVTINVCLVDATSNLVKSVQSGTTTYASTTATSATSTIPTAVTNANTVICYLGEINYDTSGATADVMSVVSLSGTTVTASRSYYAGSIAAVSWIVIEFEGAALNASVQNVAYNATPTTASWTKTITSVTPANTLLIYGGQTNIDTTRDSKILTQAVLTNSTTITYNVNTVSSGYPQLFNLCVVEFKSTVLTSNAVQRGSITVGSSVSSATATITSVNSAKAITTFLGLTTAHTGSYFPMDAYTLTLTNDTTVTATIGHQDGDAGTVGYEVGEFN